MIFITTLISLCYEASNWFYDAYTVTQQWMLPFRYIAGYMYWVSTIFKRMSYAFNDFKTWLTWAADRISQILNISTITSYFQTWINYATTAYNWIINAANIITYNIGAWWNTAQQTVSVWIENAKQWALVQVNNLANTLAPVVAGWNSFVSKIPSLNEIISWFTNWWANVLSHLSSWWNERLSDIGALLLSWTLDLAPFWAGWQEIRDKVFTFFNNPLEWLLAEFTDWFLGAE